MKVERRTLEILGRKKNVQRFAKTITAILAVAFKRNKCTAIEMEFIDCTITLYGLSVKLSSLNEGKAYDIGKGYDIRKDGPHGGQGKPHLHICRNGNELMSLNFDGTAHDGSHNKTIPNHAADWIRSKYPEVNLPPNNLIESIAEYAFRKAIGIAI